MSAWPSFRVFPARNLTGQTKMVKDSANVVDLQMSLVQKIGQLGKAKIRFGVQIGRSKVSGEQMGIGGCGDHRGVVGGKRAAGKKDIHAHAARLWTQSVLAIRSWRPRRRRPGPCAIPFPPRRRACASRDREPRRTENWKSGRASAGCKEAANRRPSQALLQSFLAGFNFLGEFGMRADVVQHGGLDSAEAEIVGVSFDLHGAKIQSVLIAELIFAADAAAMRGDLIDDRAAGIAEREQPRDFVIGFSGGIVARAAEAPVLESARCGVAVFASRTARDRATCVRRKQSGKRRATPERARQGAPREIQRGRALPDDSQGSAACRFPSPGLCRTSARPGAIRPGPGRA